MSINTAQLGLNNNAKFFSWFILIVSILIFTQVKNISLFASIMLTIGCMLLLWHMPELGIALVLLLSTHTLMLYSYDDLPDIKLMPGFRFNALDLLLIGMFIIGLIKLSQRKERPMFLWLLIIFAIISIWSLIWSILQEEADWDNGLLVFRTMFTYSFYFCVVGNIQTKKQFKFLIKWLYIILLVSAIIQVYEVTLGDWLSPLGKASALEEFQGRSVEISGQELAYIWNRAVTYSYLGLFLVLGSWLTGNSQGLSFRKQILLISSGLIAFILTMVRSWYVMIIVGIFAILLFGHRQRKKLFSIILIGILLVVLLNAFWSFGSGNKVDILNLITSRFSTIFDLFSGKTLHVNSRMLLLNQQLELFFKKPIFGYGFSNSINLYSGDIGLGNTLLRFGLIGLTWVLLLFYSFYSNTVSLLKKLPQSLEKGYLSGMLGAWTGMIVGYSFSWDFFTSKEGIFLVTLMLAIVDRINILFNPNKDYVTLMAFDDEKNKLR